ncbi:MAG: transporter substrate-binding domain-containing protein [Rhodospirillales bacterium]
MRQGLFVRRKAGFRAAIGCWVLACLLAMMPSGWCAETADGQTTYTVGIIEAPPFAMKDSQGQWQGIAVDLWQHVAYDLGLSFKYQEMSIPDLIAGLQQGKLLAVATATASADRELVIDFSHPYYSSGLAIAVPVKARQAGWFEPLRDVFSEGTVKITAVLLGLLLVAGIVVWLCERKVNAEHFSARPSPGIRDGVWWAAVTLTTVGYGDKAPKTTLGRLIGVIWMFVAVILIALFTAQVTSSLTVTSLAGHIRGPADLVHVQVGTIRDSPAQVILQRKFGVSARGYPGFGEGLAALDRGEIDAFVGVEPVVRYEVARGFHGRLAIVGVPFMRVDYVFGLPLDSPIRQQINRSILAFIETDGWRELVHQYLGSDS